MKQYLIFRHNEFGEELDRRKANEGNLQHELVQMAWDSKYLDDGDTFKIVLIQQ